MSKIKKKTRKKQIIIALIIVAILAVIVISSISRYRKNQEENKIITEKIEKRTIVSSISATGTIKSSSTKEFTTTLVGSEVKSVNVKVGDKVNIGDTLLTFNVDSLNDSLNLAQEGLNITRQQTNLSINAAQKGVNTAADTRNSQYSSLDSSIQDIENNIKEIDNQIATAQNAVKPLQTAESLAKTNLDTVTATNQPIINEYNAKKQEYSNSLIEYEKGKAEYSNLEVRHNQLFSSTGDQLDSAGSIINPSDYTSGIYATEEHKSVHEGLQVAQSNLPNLEAMVGSAKVALDALEATYSNAQETINSAQGQYNNAASAVQSAQAGVAELASAKTGLEAQLKQTKSTADTTKKSLDSALDNAALSLDSSILTAKSSILTQENQIKTVREQISKGILMSDVSGTVTAVNVDAGDMYQGGTLIKVEGCETFIVEAQIDEYDIADIAVGMKVKIKTDATRDEELIGRVTFVAPSATESTSAMAMTGMTSTTGDATYKVEIAVDSVNSRLRIGMNAKLSIITEEAENALTVPYDAIEEREDGKTVIQVLETDGETVKEIEVTKGLESDYYTEIKSSNVKEGMEVVVPDTGNGDALSTLINTMQSTSGF